MFSRFIIASILNHFSCFNYFWFINYLIDYLYYFKQLATEFLQFHHMNILNHILHLLLCTFVHLLFPLSFNILLLLFFLLFSKLLSLNLYFISQFSLLKIFLFLQFSFFYLNFHAPFTFPRLMQQVFSPQLNLYQFWQLHFFEYFQAIWPYPEFIYLYFIFP